jgi:hypothetical protein
VWFSPFQMSSVHAGLYQFVVVLKRPENYNKFDIQFTVSMTNSGTTETKVLEKKNFVKRYTANKKKLGFGPVGDYERTRIKEFQNDFTYKIEIKVKLFVCGDGMLKKKIKSE